MRCEVGGRVERAGWVAKGKVRIDPQSGEDAARRPVVASRNEVLAV
jgi:hypothetical protein